MTLTKAFAAVSASALACAAAGAAVGWTIGTLAPDAYRRWFSDGPSDEFSPVQVGIGLGLAQGLGAGVLVGIVIVAIVAWHDVRIAEQDPR